MFIIYLIYTYSELNQIIKNKKDMFKKLICERCTLLKNNANLDLNKKDKEKMQNYLTYINKVDPNKLIDDLFTNIAPSSIIFYVVDIHDLETTINQKVLNLIAKKKIEMVFIINKYDILPKEIVEERMKVWVGETLKSITANVVSTIFYIY